MGLSIFFSHVAIVVALLVPEVCQAVEAKSFFFFVQFSHRSRFGNEGGRIERVSYNTRSETQ